MRAVGRWLLLLASCLGAGCSTGNVMIDTPRQVACGVIGLGLCDSIDARYSTTVAEGMALDAPYAVKKDPAGRFVLTSTALNKAIVFADLQSITKTQSFRTSDTTFDLYQAPVAGCPRRYMAVIGRGRTLRTSAFGCGEVLQFTSVASRNVVYATQAPSGDGSTPWTYRIDGQGAGQPRALTAYRDHPDYADWSAIERGVATRKPASGAQRESSARQAAAPAASREPRGAAEAPRPAPSATRVSSGRPPLPNPEVPVVPKEVDEGEIVYEKPHVQL